MKILIMTATVLFGAGLVTAPLVAQSESKQIVLAQSDTDVFSETDVIDSVTQAEHEVDVARAALRAAMAGNGNVREARRALRRALRRLDQARENPDQPLPPLETPSETVEVSPKIDDGPPPLPVQVPEEVAPEVVVETEDNRIIVRRGSQLEVRHDDTARLESGGARRLQQVNPDGTTTTTIVRRNGTRIVTVRDDNGEIIERSRHRRNGAVEFLIGGAAQQPAAPVFDLHISLPQLEISIPQRDYVVESESASDRQLEQALIAPPVEQVERSYSLREIRRSGRLRNKLRRIDIDTVTFEFGSAAVPRDQIRRMERIGRVLSRTLARNPEEVFLIEGHTDAVGADLSNLALSDRRADAVAQILTFYFSVPSENLITQGYGEQFLKIPTAGPERENRRVTLRRITPLLRGGDAF
ncbi:MAG: OmpA family protein [Alphaproteobacteria bacterium]